MGEIRILISDKDPFKAELHSLATWRQTLLAINTLLEPTAEACPPEAPIREDLQKLAKDFREMLVEVGISVYKTQVIRQELPADAHPPADGAPEKSPRLRSEPPEGMGSFGGCWSRED